MTPRGTASLNRRAVRMCSCISPPSRWTASRRSRRARQWSSRSFRATRDSTRRTSLAPPDRSPRRSTPPAWLRRAGFSFTDGYLALMTAPPAAAERLFLVDGYALIYRAFFAMISRPLTTARGENTSAAWGATNFLLRLHEKHRPAYLGWVHDVGVSFREQAYPEYKATREKLDEQLQQDFERAVERIEEILDAFSVPVIGIEGFEADDVIGTLATAAAERGLQAVIVSGDKDFYQLIGPRIVLLNPGRGGPAAVEEQWVDQANASERLGVPPERVVDYLALVGDSSDNVPGVKGIGEKTALELLGTYGDLDTILTRAPEVTGKRAREALLQHSELARLSRDLVTIRRDAPVSLDLDRLRVRPPDIPRLRELFTELEFRSLIPKLDRLVGLGAPPPRSPRRDTTSSTTGSCCGGRAWSSLASPTTRRSPASSSIPGVVPTLSTISPGRSWGRNCAPMRMSRGRGGPSARSPRFPLRPRRATAATTARPCCACGRRSPPSSRTTSCGPSSKVSRCRCSRSWPTWSGRGCSSTANCWRTCPTGSRPS